MRYGICILPEHRWPQAEGLWRRAEELGFDHAWTYDHLVWGGLVGHPWFGTTPTLTAAAMVTERIRLGTFVTSPNYRHPMTFLRDVLSLDDISGGRFLCGVGAGGEPDGTLLGGPALTPGDKAGRLEEFVDLLDLLLTSDHVDAHGHWFDVVDGRTAPGPVQQPRVPFVIAANGPRTLRLAARHGQGWVTIGPTDATDVDGWWAGVARLVDRLHTALDAADRPRDSIDRYLNLDAGPMYSLSSADAFDDAVGRAAEFGFTDVVAHWPRPDAPYAGDVAVLDEVAARHLGGR